MDKYSHHRHYIVRSKKRQTIRFYSSIARQENKMKCIPCSHFIEHVGCFGRRAKFVGRRSMERRQRRRRRLELRDRRRDRRFGTRGRAGLVHLAFLLGCRRHSRNRRTLGNANPWLRGGRRRCDAAVRSRPWRHEQAAGEPAARAWCGAPAGEGATAELGFPATPAEAGSK